MAGKVDHYEWHAAVRAYFRDPCKPGTIVAPVGLLGQMLVVGHADDAQRASGQLWVCKHEMPGFEGGLPSQEHQGIILPWLLWQTGIDTRKAKQEDPVYLSAKGGWTLAEPHDTVGRVIGKVMRVGPAASDGVSDGGAILFSPNAV